ncbi:hypothetical protein BGX34_008853 [Mortierella sp. NVP85]|nr:hypothetical protein BGX34_008853 [Mortierella sp. NVP85]
MAPIPRIAAKPLSIITGALFSAFAAPKSSPPSNGLNATVWGADYTGTASLFKLASPSSSTPSPTSSSSSPSSSPSSPLPSSSLVLYDTKTNTYKGCNEKTFAPTDNVALMNPLQFGDVKSSNTTCGNWILIRNRENTMQSTYAQVVGVCDDCEYGSVDLSLGALSELAPDTPFDDIIFDPASTATIDDLMDPLAPLPVESTSVSPKNLLNIVWTLADAPQKRTGSDTPAEQNKPTTTGSSATPTTTTTTTTSAPEPTSAPAPQFSGRATWYSDTTGLCEHSYSQSDLIVAVNEAQMGRDKKLCGKKIRLSKKGSDVSVVVTVVDMCPGKYCNFGDLDLSQGAFKKFADLGVGVLQLQWSFL